MPRENCELCSRNYACHATTLSFNRVHGDWPGTAMEAIERDHPGVDGPDRHRLRCGSKPPSARHGGTRLSSTVRRLRQKCPVCYKSRRSTGRFAAGLNRGAKASRFRSNQRLLARNGRSAPSPRINPRAYLAQKNLARLDRGEKHADGTALSRAGLELRRRSGDGVSARRGDGGL